MAKYMIKALSPVRIVTVAFRGSINKAKNFLKFKFSLLVVRVA